jgi:hypothetical protein
MGAIVGGMMNRFLGAALVGAVLSSGCVSLREIVGLPAEFAPTVSLRAEPRWVLVKNPRFGDLPSEPQYIWVEEDKIPLSFRRFISGKRSVLAPPDVVARYGRPPGGGKISPLQGGLSVADQAPSPSSPRVEPAPTEVAPPTRGFVVFVDTNRVVIDLTAQDGIQPGSVVSLRRSRAPIVHPVTGEVLGELDMEVARGKVLEVREQFSVVELQSVTPGTQVKVKDRAIPR